MREHTARIISLVLCQGQELGWLGAEAQPAPSLTIARPSSGELGYKRTAAGAAAATQALASLATSGLWQVRKGGAQALASLATIGAARQTLFFMEPR